MFKIKKITNSIVCLSAPTQEKLGNSFLRFQEHYESPEWREKIFTEGQFRMWYSEKYGANTYSKDWTGFNFPSYILNPFIKGLFDPLTEAEKELVNLFKYRTDKFYIIGAQDGNPDTLDHEICHGLYYTNEAYKKDVNEVLIKYKQELTPVYKHIKGLMYHPAVHDDEVHAWVSASKEDLKAENVQVNEDAHKLLRKIKKKYCIAED